jgi:serine/threonine-protein kinase
VVSDLRVIPGGRADLPGLNDPPPGGQTRVIPPTDAFPAPSSFDVGATIGNYLIVSKIGEGGMGIVYKAHDTTLDRTVALKVLSPHLFRNQEFLNRFRVEAQAQARLNGPNIVTLHSMFEIPGSLVLVMEYVEGHTLDQRLHNEGRLSVASTVWVFEQALLGVERAHRMGIVHRDLKPSNIFITNTHEVKLMDFGVAKILDSKANTQSGSMIGTLMYISPEQIKGQDADFRSDIYTLGITLYQAVTGVLPFEKKTDYEYMNAHLHEAPLPPTSLQPAIPQELEDIILKAMDKEPNRRFQNAHEFRKALLKVGMVHVRAYRRLKAIRKEKDKAALSTSPTYRREDTDTFSLPLTTWLDRIKDRKIAVGSGIAVLAAVGIAVSWFMRPEPAAVVPPLVQAPAAAIPDDSVMASSVPPPAVTTTVAAAPAAPQPAKTTEPTARPVATPAPVAAAPRPAPRREPPAAKAPEPKKQGNPNYDALKKAWGG